MAGFSGPIDERAFESENWPPKLRCYVKSLAFCEESNCDSEDVRIRKCDCLIRKIDRKGNT
eukprot:2917082-Heterocapsa_arctica.AAC.1